MWAGMVIVLAACAVCWGIDLTTRNLELWLIAGLVPPAVMLLIWRGPQPVAAQLLYSVNSSSKDARPWVDRSRL